MHTTSLLQGFSQQACVLFVPAEAKQGSPLFLALSTGFTSVYRRRASSTPLTAICHLCPLASWEYNIPQKHDLASCVAGVSGLVPKIVRFCRFLNSRVCVQ